MQVTGELILKKEVQVITEKFQKREFVIKTNEQYAQEIIFELHQDRTDLIDPYNLNETITVDFNLRGNSYVNKEGETKHINTLQAWKIQR